MTVCVDQIRIELTGHMATYLDSLTNARQLNSYKYKLSDGKYFSIVSLISKTHNEP